jgi:signal transduction histidine kinase/CheY-like chemotaxis protein
MFGDEALGYVVLDVPINAHRAWLLEGLSGHLSSAIYEISRTEQLRLARELAEAANSAKTAFVAMMSHEVRTPLNAIMGNLDLCLRTELSKEQRTQLTRAQTSSRALRGIVDDILDYSRVEAHRIDLESIPFDLEEVLEQILSTCAPDACRKNLELVLDVDLDVPRRLVGDSLRLTQVLLNLVNNAVKFSTHGFVALRVIREHDDSVDLVQLRFKVEDTGIGMNPEQLSRIFQPFTQADNTITRRYGGTGLGLTICQRLVELMGGEIQVRSEVGSGSTFEFGIPMRIDADVYTATPAEPARVVLAVDSPAQLDSIARLLCGLGHEVHKASTGADALRILEQLPPLGATRRCFVFADQRLTDMTGQQLFSRLHGVGDGAALSLALLVPYDNNTLLSSDLQNTTGETVLAKPPLRSSIERVLRGARTSRPVSLTDRSELGAASGRLVGQRVLVVQDSDLSRELACDLLASNGAEVSTATDGAEAITLACNEHFDLVLMDLHLPVVDGCSAAKTIREHHSASDLPIVALSASAAPEDRLRCLEAGMNDFLRAPIGAAELVDTVHRWLSCGDSPVLRASSTPPASTAMRMGATTAPVLDVAKALGRLGGNRSLYRQLLRRFAQSHASNSEELTGLLDALDYTKSANLVHTLVSAAGNIGAIRLQHAAQSLELALRQAHQGRVFALRPRFEAEWQASIRAVNNALDRHLEGSRPPPSSSAQAAVFESIAQLRKLIADHDTAAVELVESLEAAFVAEPHTQQALQCLAQSVSAYDFEAAQLHLDSLSTSLSGKAPPLPQGIN